MGQEEVKFEENGGVKSKVLCMDWCFGTNKGWGIFQRFGTFLKHWIQSKKIKIEDFELI